MSVPEGGQYTLEVWGDFACFTRPEAKVERFSYPCPTPSAARGIFDAIYWKNASCDNRTGAPKASRFYWQIHRIEMLQLPSYIALRRNEVKDKAPSDRTIKQWMKGSKTPEPIWADASGESKGRTQRQTMAIRNPRFRLTASIVPHGEHRSQHAAFNAQYLRRARKGKCFQQPYLGCREFVCFFRHIERLEGESEPVDYNQNLGLMLYDVFDLSMQNGSNAKAAVSLFQAQIRGGVLDVPPYDSPLVLKPERRVL